MIKNLEHKVRLIEILFLILITVLVYSNTLQNAFIWDDHDLINDPYISSLKNIPFFFSIEYWFEHNPLNRPLICRPLRAISLALDYALWGSNPMGYHLTNLLYHLVNVILTYFLILNLAQKKYLKAPFWIALLFAVHPVNTEVVAWIKNRTELLGYMFALAALMFFIKALQKKVAVLPLCGSLLCYYLALSAKETYLILPLLLWGYLLCFSLKIKTLGLLLPFLVIIVIHPVFLTMLNFFLYKFSNQITIPTYSYILHTIPLGVGTLCSYLGLMLLPVNLNAQYQFSGSLTSVWIGCVFLGGLLFLLFRPTKNPYLSFAIIWILITILPVSNIIPIIIRPFAEQRLYLPCLGFCIFIVFLRENVKLLTVLLTSLVIIYSVLVFQRNFIWKNEVTVSEDSVKKDPDNARMHYCLANALIVEKNDMQKALKHYAAALELEPQIIADSFKDALKSMEQFNNFNKNITAFYDFIKDDYLRLKLEFDSDPKNAKLHYFYGLLFTKLGDTDSAVREYQKALKAEPDFLRALHKLAKFYSQSSQYQKALFYYQRIIKILPAQYRGYYYYNLACLHARQKQNDQAVENLEKAVAAGFCDWNLLKSDPDLVSIHKSWYYKFLLIKLGK